MARSSYTSETTADGVRFTVRPAWPSFGWLVFMGLVAAAGFFYLAVMVLPAINPTIRFPGGFEKEPFSFLQFIPIVIGAVAAWRIRGAVRQTRPHAFLAGPGGLVLDDGRTRIAAGTVAEIGVHDPAEGYLAAYEPVTVAAGGTGAGGAALASATASVAAIQSVTAVAHAANAAQAERSVSVSVRLKGTDKRVVVARGLTAEPADDLARDVADALSGATAPQGSASAA